LPKRKNAAYKARQGGFMDIDIEPARRGRRPSSKHDSETPAYRIIYGVFESQATFCEETGVPLGTANLWLS
jgi:hypothetical protein